MNWNSRTQLLVGEEGVKKLADTHVLVVGLGGVAAGDHDTDHEGGKDQSGQFFHNDCLLLIWVD